MRHSDFYVGLALLLLLTLGGALKAQTRVAPFTPIGGGRGQVVNIRVIALGASGAVCRGAVSFRSVPAGDPVGPFENIFLHQGETTTVRLLLGSLGIGAGQRAEVQPVVQLTDSSCFASVELSDDGGRLSAVYVSGSMLAPNRPPEAADSPFVVARSIDGVELTVTRIQPADGDAQPCDVHIGFRDETGKPIGAQSDVALAPGAARQLTVDMQDFFPPQASSIRVLLDVRPTQDGSATGCAAAAQVYERLSGGSLFSDRPARSRSHTGGPPGAPTHSGSAPASTNRRTRANGAAGHHPFTTRPASRLDSNRQPAYRRDDRSRPASVL